MKHLATIILLLNSVTPAFATLEACPGKKVTSIAGMSRDLFNYTTSGFDDRTGFSLNCQSATGSSYLFYAPVQRSYLISSYEACKQIQESMDLNPDHVFVFSLSHESQFVLDVTRDPNRICKSRQQMQQEMQQSQMQTKVNL